MNKKFRAWNVKGGFYEESFFIDKIGCLYKTQQAILSGFEDRLISFNGILEQWTGLYDENFKEIFDGDILESKKNLLYDDGYKVSVVKFVDGIFKNDLVPISILCGGFKPKVIGNIHQNKELLK